MTALAIGLSVVAIAVSYLLGSIPFGYLIGLWVKGIDVRTVGSGNIGATNVGRALGFRYFWVVFLLDLAKGYLPTWGFPKAVAALTGASAPPDLAVLVALVSILGHNYPVYLKFQGGKGVATSLGAMFALDAISSLAAAVGFTAFLGLTGYVSLSSLLAGGVFFIVHFSMVTDAWSPRERAMSVLTTALLILLPVRHRKNLARIWQGTEPKVSVRKRKNRPAGRIAAGWLVAIAATPVVAIGGWVYFCKAIRRDVLTVGRYSFSEVARAGTGHQRAERVAFADGGNVLVVTCPRYDRLVFYRVTAKDQLEPIQDRALDGKPVAVCPANDRVYVLLRPPGDRRHVEPGWWETFDLRGESLGGKVVVDFYPDDMAITPDAKHAVVLTSGRGEGSHDRPSPMLTVYDLADGARSIGRIRFEDDRDDPSRLNLSVNGACVAVSLHGSDTVAAIDLGDLANPRLIGRTPLPDLESPYPSRTADDAIVMPVKSGGDAVVLPLSGFGDCVASALPRGSGLVLIRASDGKSLGRLTLRAGSFNLGNTRPTGFAYTPERNLIAVANRSGGVHLVAVRLGAESIALAR